MAKITIRNIPEEVFEKRSLNSEMLVIIEKGAESENTEEIIRDIHGGRTHDREVDS